MMKNTDLLTHIHPECSFILIVIKNPGVCLQICYLMSNQETDQIGLQRNHRWLKPNVWRNLSNIYPFVSRHTILQQCSILGRMFMHAIVWIEFLEGLFKGVLQRQQLQQLKQVFIAMAFKSLSVINPTLLEEFTISSMGKTTLMRTNMYQRLP